MRIKITVTCVGSNNGIVIMFEKTLYMQKYILKYLKEEKKSYHFFTFLFIILLFLNVYMKSNLVLVNIQKYSMQMQQLFHYNNLITKESY